MINGIQHIGLGVRNRERSFNFYNNALRFSVPISKDTGNCSGMISVLEKDEKRNVIIALNPYGGGLVELFQYVSKTPQPVLDEVDFTYNGLLFFGLKVKNINESLKIIEKHGGQMVTPPSYFTPMSTHHWKTAVFRDVDGIYGTLLEYPSSNIGYGNGPARIGGVEYVAVGVSNLGRSLEFYSRVLGYDNVMYRTEGEYPEWYSLFGSNRKIKRALLKRSSMPQGLFKHFLRGGMIELIEVEGNKGRHIYENRKWGDIGFMELCFDVTNILSTIKDVTRKGAELIVQPHSQDMGLNTRATFAYIQDPDGSMLEFADIGSLPVPYFLIRLLVNPPVVEIAKKFKIL